jgi:hypothetical protein
MNPNGYYIENTHEFQQDVSGEGYVMVYQYVNTNNLSLKNYMHGSGVMDSATLINSQQKPSKSGLIFSRLRSRTQREKPYICQIQEKFIQIRTMTALLDLPSKTRWFSLPWALFTAQAGTPHPVEYNSLLKERAAPGTTGWSPDASSDRVYSRL